ncbi:MAG: RNA polymerase sigma-70 factor [Nocardioidaceae bacterium]|nr:RNA polymerase sigma-70 factor [Nocardioidaceae bacterium]
MSDDQGFAEHRGLLFTVAYEMLGSAADAEDVVQETWLRWAGVDHAEVHDARAYLVRITTRLALNRLRTLARRRESYVGPWLPEPLLTVPDVADDVALADSVSTAMLLVLETLAPVERAVFVLREVFDLPYDEIAVALDKSADAVRQTALRARRHVAARRPRQAVERSETLRVIESFLAAVSTGELQPLMDVLAPDVVLLSDGGGVVSAARRPVVGRDNVARFLDGVARKGAADAEVDLAWVNGLPAIRAHRDGQVVTVVTLAVEAGLVTGVYVVVNPDKLARLGEPVGLTR